MSTAVLAHAAPDPAGDTAEQAARWTESSWRSPIVLPQVNRAGIVCCQWVGRGKWSPSCVEQGRGRVKKKGVSSSVVSWRCQQPSVPAAVAASLELRVVWESPKALSPPGRLLARGHHWHGSRLLHNSKRLSAPPTVGALFQKSLGVQRAARAADTCSARTNVRPVSPQLAQQLCRPNCFRSRALPDANTSNSARPSTAYATLPFNIHHDLRQHTRRRANDSRDLNQIPQSWRRSCCTAR